MTIPRTPQTRGRSDSGDSRDSRLSEFDDEEDLYFTVKEDELAEEDRPGLDISGNLDAQGISDLIKNIDELEKDTKNLQSGKYTSKAITSQDGSQSREVFLDGQPVGKISSKSCSLKNPPDRKLVEMFFKAHKGTPSEPAHLTVESCPSIEKGKELIALAEANHVILHFSPAARNVMKQSLIEEHPGKPAQDINNDFVLQTKSFNFESSNDEVVKMTPRPKM